MSYPSNTFYAHYVGADLPNRRRTLLAGPFSHGRQAEQWIGPAREAAERVSLRTGEAEQVYFASYALVRVRRRPDASFPPGRLNQVLGLTRTDTETGWLATGPEDCAPPASPALNEAVLAAGPT